MNRLIGTAAILGLSAVSVWAGAPDQAGGLFDGKAGAKTDLPEMRIKLTRPGTPPAAPGKRPSSDLFYFSPEEAEAAAAQVQAQQFKIFDTEGWKYGDDVPQKIKAQMETDLAFIKGIKGGGATPLHQEIFGKVDGAGYLSWFDERISFVGMDDCGSGNAVACVIPFAGPSKMWLTENFVKFDHPQIARMMVVFHEARHTEVTHFFWGHATCPTPFKDGQGRDMRSIWTGAPLAGEPACDNTHKGSYGSSTIMLKNIQKHCANCTAKVRMDAGLYGDDQLGRITDKASKQKMQDDFAR
ncbi:MAG: hypothetical protein WC943_02495 [Elusimicrobiota bacterium]|jgi:hypothetical protein